MLKLLEFYVESAPSWYNISKYISRKQIEKNRSGFVVGFFFILATLRQRDEKHNPNLISI